MAIYIVNCNSIDLTDDVTQITAEVTISTRTTTTRYPTIGATVYAAVGGGVNATNTNILSAAIALARAQHGLTVNQGGTDRSGMAGGRTV